MTPNDLLGVGEAAAVLGVARQRLYQLRARVDFPAPFVELACGPIWLRDDIEAFARLPRPNGRPRQS